MAYTDEDKVKGMVRGLELSASTAVTPDDIELWITQQDAYINGRLAPFYAVPITGTISLSIVELISTYKVAHMVKMKLELTTQNSDQKQDVQGNLDKMAEDMLKKLLPAKAGEQPLLRLPDAEFLPISPVDGAVMSLQSKGPPTFTKGGNNW